MEQPNIGFIKAINTGFITHSVKPGSVISFTVLEKLSEGVWIVDIRGKKIKVQSSISLIVGKKLEAKVLMKDGKLFLRILDSRTPVESAIQKFSLPRNDISKMIIEGFIRQGLPLKEEMLRKAVLLLQDIRPPDQQSARLIALLFDKGLFLTRQQFEKFHHLLYDFPVNPQRQAEARRRKQQDSGHEGQKERENRRKKDKNKVRKLLLQNIQTRGREDNLLQLFNHLEAPHNNWIIVPLSFQTEISENAPDRGVLRLHTVQQGRVDKFTITFSGKRDWHFSGDMSPGKRLIRWNVDPLPDRKGKMEIVSKLREKLSNLSFEIDDTISEVLKFSVYGDEDAPDIKKIDTVI